MWGLQEAFVRIPIKQPGFNGKYARGPFFVAHMMQLGEVAEDESSERRCGSDAEPVEGRDGYPVEIDAPQCR